MIFNVQRFSEEDLPKQSIKSLKKGIRSLRKVIVKHEEKIKNPQLYYPEWNELTDDERRGSFIHWKKEIENAQQSILDRVEELEKRGVKIDE